MQVLEKTKLIPCFSRGLVSFLLFLVLISPLFPQTYQFKTYSIEEGLPHSEVYAICQDKQGYLWIGTAAGLARYDGRNFENFTIADGLSSNIIYSIFNDSRGELWIGTGKGISKKENVFSDEKIRFVDISRKAALTPNRITSITEDVNKEIWFGTAGPHEAIWIYNIGNENSFRYLSKVEGLLSDKVFSLFTDSDSNIWVGYFSGGISVFHQKNIYHFSNFNNPQKSGTIWNIFEDYKKNIWVSTDDGVYRFSSIRFETGNKANASIFNLPALASYKIRVALEDGSKNLWFATNNGIFYSDNTKNAENSFSNLLHLLPPNGLSANSFWSAIKDREGNLWFGSFGGGINKFNGFTFMNYSKKEGLNNEQIQCINEDHLSRIMVGTEAGSYIFNNQTGQNDSISFRNVSTPNISNKIIYDIEKDSVNKLFIATYGTGLQILSQSGKNFIPKLSVTEKDGLFSNKIFSICKSKLNEIWCATPLGLSRIIFDKKSSEYNGIDTIFNYKQFGIFSRLYFSIEDQKHNIWVGSNFGIACLKYDPALQKYTPMNVRLGQKFYNNIVYSLIEDHRRNIWACVYGFGLVMIPYNQLNKDTPKCRLFTNNDGLNNPNINSLLFDNDSNLWLGTVKGIIKFDYLLFIKKNEIKFTAYGLTEGFFGIECKPNAVYKDHEGKLWFGTGKGVTVYNSKYDRKNEIKPIINLKSIKIHFKDQDLKKYLTSSAEKSTQYEFPIQDNHLTFEFAGISLSIPEKVRYQFKLEGADKDWSPVTSENKITYSNLEPGKYKFRVKACNNDGVWSENPTLVTFKINPPYWETWWFYTLQISFLVLLLGASFKAGHSKTNTRIATILIFICIFILFEFVQTLLEPYFILVVGGAPIFKVIINLILAVILFPLEKFIRKYLEGKKEKV